VLQRRIIRFLHDHRAGLIRRRRLIQLTPLAVFRETAARIIEASQVDGRAVAVLPILPAPIQVRRRNPLLAREIEAYNAALRSVCGPARFFEVEELIGARGIDDIAAGPESVHLNQEGHILLADRLAEWLRSAQVQSLRA
jgi:lysophospholipase L1-like esterase